MNKIKSRIERSILSCCLGAAYTGLAGWEYAVNTSVRARLGIKLFALRLPNPLNGAKESVS